MGACCWCPLLRCDRPTYYSLPHHSLLPLLYTYLLFVVCRPAVTPLDVLVVKHGFDTEIGQLGNLAGGVGGMVTAMGELRAPCSFEARTRAGWPKRNTTRAECYHGRCGPQEHE